MGLSSMAGIKIQKTKSNFTFLVQNIFCHQFDLISYIELLESDEQQLRLLLCFSPHLQHQSLILYVCRLISLSLQSSL